MVEVKIQVSIAVQRQVIGSLYSLSGSYRSEQLKIVSSILWTAISRCPKSVGAD